MPKRKKEELKDDESVKRAKPNPSNEELESECIGDALVCDINVHIPEYSGRKRTKKRRKVKTTSRARREKDRERKRLERITANKTSESEWIQSEINIDAYCSKNYVVQPKFECNRTGQTNLLVPDGNEFESSNVDGTENLTKSFSYRRNERYRKRYHEDSGFRERKQYVSRIRYQQDVLYKEKMKANQSIKHRQDSQYREKVMMQKRQFGQIKYTMDKSYQNKKKKYSAFKYRTEPRYRQLKLSLSSQKYKNCRSYRIYRLNRSIQKYKDNIQHKMQVKATSVCKYKEDEVHRQKVKASSIHKYKEDEVHRQKVKASSVHKYKEDELHRQKVKASSICKYKEDELHRQKVKASSICKYKEDELHKQKVKASSICKYKEDELHRQKVKASGICKYRDDDCYRQQVKNASVRKYRDNIKHRQHLKDKTSKKYRESFVFRQKVKSNLRDKYSNNPAIKAKKMEMVHKRRLESGQNESNLALFFRQQVQDGPKFICSVCHKFKFRKQVVVCDIQKYETRSHKSYEMASRCIDNKFSSKCTDECKKDCEMLHHNKLWICFTCHYHLLKAQMPADAAANNLQLQPVPNSLEKLNSLERQLLSLRIPFMKLVSLPKSGQKGIMGPCVSVPTDIEKTTRVLPRCESDNELIRLKLKRKLAYKGHSQYQYVSPSKLKKGLQYLKENNKWYKDIQLHQNWRDPFAETNSTSDTNHDNEDYQYEIEDQHTDKQENVNVVENDEDDDPSTKDKAPPFDTCLQPADIGQEILDQCFEGIFCLAPGEGKTPVSMLKEVGNEAMTFPAQFPDGCSTYDEKRAVKLTRLKYFHSRLLSADSRFANDTQYVFYAQYLSELEQVISQVSIALRKGTGKDNNGRDITADIIKDGNELNNLLKTDQGYKFLTPIRGTPPYWQSTLKDLFAMIRQLGIPTWFCTFSAADMRWYEVLQILLAQQGIDKSPEQLNWLEKCDILKNSAVMNSVLFDHRFHTLLKSIIIDKQVIGKVKDYFYRIEFQQRGSPHTHCLFWIQDAPLLDTNDDRTVCSFVDRYVTCSVPEEEEDSQLHEMVSNVQQHSKGHSKSRRKKGTTCRFNFPRPPSNRTFISRSQSITDPSNDLPPQQIINNAKETLQTLWTVINNTDIEEITTNNLFAAAGITQEQFEEASNILTKRTSVVLKRTPKDTWINQYNPSLLRCWNANMDIQYITDAYSCVMYIISYISKAEREMGLVLEEARKEAAEGNLHAQDAMKKIGGAYFHQREVSAQEAAYRVCGLHLKESSRKVQFISVGKDPVRMSKPLSLIQSRTDEDDDIWMPTITERYHARPFEKQFENMCLASFCSSYRVLASTQIPKDTSKTKTVFELQNGLGFIQKRTRSQAAVIRYPRFSEHKDPELYFKSLLQLFLPHRYEAQLKPPSFQSYKDFYSTGAVKLSQNSSTLSVSAIVDSNRQQYEVNADALDEAQDLMDKVGCLEDAWAMISPESESDRIECQIEKSSKQSISGEDHAVIPELCIDNRSSADDHCVEFASGVLSTEDALPLLRSLNKQQKEVFYIIRQWCLDKVNGKQPKSFQLFITGGAGTGKSHLIKCIQYEANKILSPCASNPDDTVVLLTAPTGTAAFQINGTTLHQAFALPKLLSLPYQHMRDEKLNTLRCKLQSLEILIIDEISMVGQKVLTYVHERLRQIKQSGNALFGNVCVIAVGDFYQLPPVKQTTLYDLRPKNYFNLWTPNFSVVCLHQIMRQREDAYFAELLNRIRVKPKGKSLDEGDLKCLQDCQNKSCDINALHIFGTNNEVDDHNSKMLHEICKEHECIPAQDFDKDAVTGKLIKRDTPYTTSSDYLPSELVLAKGARVMLIRNVDISDGLVNGVVGTVCDITRSPDTSHLISVSVIFDNNRIGQKQRRSRPSVSSEQTNRVVITVTEETLHNSAVRHQLPLRLSWACTVHKVQGITTDKLVVSFKKIFSPGMAYVALSRVTSLAGLVIKDFDEDKIYCTKQVSEALQQMPSFLTQPATTMSGQNTINLLLHNIQGLLPHIDDLRANEDIAVTHFICLTETWMQKEVNPILDNFSFHSKTRFSSYGDTSTLFKTLKTMKNGGVGIFSRNTFNFHELQIHKCNVEFVAFKIAKINTTVVVIYRPSIYKTSEFLQQLQLLLKQLPHDKPTLIIGDFNQDILKNTSTVMNFMKDQGYLQLVNTATTDGNTAIDHVYLKGNISVDISVVPAYYSYHNMISLKVNSENSDLNR